MQDQQRINIISFICC